MLTHRGDWRVAVVVRPLDRALSLLRLGLIPFGILVASLPTYRALIGAFGAASDSLTVALSAVTVGLAYVLLFQSQPIGSRVDLLFARLRRRLTLACRQDVARTSDEARLACWLTSDALRAPLFDYKDQTEAVHKLTDACRQGRRREFWFVEGESGTGKTRAGLLVVRALVRDLDLLEFGNRSYLYDFRNPRVGQQALRKSLGTSRHDHAVVLVDNFHLVHGDLLREVTHHLLGPNPPNERLLVFLTQPPDAWNLRPGSEVRLVSEAKAADRHLALSGPPAESIARSLSRFDASGSQLLWDLQDDPVGSAAQLHLAQVIARNRSTPPELSTTLGRGDVADAAALDLMRALAVVTGLSMHRGTFSRRAFRRALRAASDQGPWWSTLPLAVRARSTLRRLRRVGLISRGHNADFEFHEATATLCIDRLSALPPFQIPFTVVGQSRIRDPASGDDAVTAWLAAVEIGAQEMAEAFFDSAIAKGSYTRMLSCLRRAGARYPLLAPLRLQLAILLDRSGDFAASREEFSDELVEQLDPSSELAVIFTATRLEASHDRDSIARIEELCRHSERLVAIVGEYWKLHIAAHHGSFASQKLLDLATEALGLLESRSRESHWLNYSVGRMHFDSLRHHYLEGGLPVDAVAAPERRAVAEYLRERVVTYDAFEMLYTKAHLVGQVLLPQLGIFSERVSPQQAKLADLTASDVATVEALVRTTQRLYAQAKEHFSLYGDREADYLQADVLHAEMIGGTPDLDRFFDRLARYEKFIRATGFAQLASYPHLFYLRWHMLKFYRGLGETRTSDPTTVDEDLAAAWARQREIVRLDTEAGNEYGLMRAKLLELLLRWVLKPVPPDEVAALAAQMAERGYAREERLLTHLARTRLLPNIQLQRVFRFYPFVGQ